MILSTLSLILLLPFAIARPAAAVTPSFLSPLLNSTTVTLCYDIRHARHWPHLPDCAATITSVLARHHLPLRETLTFSHHPTAGSTQQRLPLRFHTERRRCVVELDIPNTPSSRQLPTADQASMLEVRDAAWEVLIQCVAGGDKLGGVVQVGRMGALQVSVVAGDGDRYGDGASVG